MSRNTIIIVVGVVVIIWIIMTILENRREPANDEGDQTTGGKVARARSVYDGNPFLDALSMGLTTRQINQMRRGGYTGRHHRRYPYWNWGWYYPQTYYVTSDAITKQSFLNKCYASGRTKPECEDIYNELIS